MVSLFEAVDLPLLTNLVKARQIFASELSNRLQLAMASCCAIFKPIYQKFDTRRMDDLMSPDPKQGKRKLPMGGSLFH